MKPLIIFGGRLGIIGEHSLGGWRGRSFGKKRKAEVPWEKNWRRAEQKKAEEPDKRRRKRRRKKTENRGNLQQL